MKEKLKLIIFLLIVVTIGCAQASQPISESIPLLQLCSCLGFQLTSECTVHGDVGATVWRGSIFYCPSTNNAITLRHSVFTQLRGCNNGAIIGRGIYSQNGYYVSQVNITTTSSMNNGTIECVYNNGSANTIITTSMIRIISDSLPPPNDVNLLNINATQLTFDWSPVAAECPTIYYRIDATGCGVCENTTILPIVYCTEATIEDQWCTFTVQTNACNGLNGDKSIPAFVLLKTPDAPEVDIIPVYTQTRKLSVIMTTFNEVEKFNISKGINGSAHTYQVTYIDSISGISCSIAIIPAQSCVNGTCKHLLNVSSLCPKSNGITVTVSGFNRLGEGRMSDPVTVPVTNEFFVASFDMMHNNVVCTFLSNNQQKYNLCNITYGSYSGSCHNYSQSSGSSTNAVLIGLPTHSLLQSHGATYCYTLTASNGIDTVVMNGTFAAGCDTEELSDGTQLPNGIRCPAPLENKSLGIQDGVACYTGTSIGSIAAYYCLHCDQQSIALERRLLRLCTANGSWNGDIPHCTCSVSHQSCPNGLYIGIGIAIMFCIIFTIVIITILVAILSLKKRMNKEPDYINSSQIIYDDIQNVNIDPRIGTEKNAAYITASDV